MRFVKILKELPNYYLLFFVITLFLATYIYMPSDPLIRFLDLLIGGFLGIMKAQTGNDAQKIEVANVENVENIDTATPAETEDKELNKL